MASIVENDIEDDFGGFPARPPTMNLEDFPFLGGRRNEETRRRMRNLYPLANKNNAAPSALLIYRIENWDRDQPKGVHGLESPETARYLPFSPAATGSRGSSNSALSTTYSVLPAHRNRMSNVQDRDSRYTWPVGKLPVELFEAITEHLSRDDIKSMRLTCKDFEQGVSGALFNTVVVPFNTELYDMIEQDKGAKRDIKGKGRATDHDLSLNESEPGSLYWMNATEDKDGKVYKGHGLRVFEGFGPHIKKFGMSFEVREEALQDPPKKKALDHLESYYGSYDWPPPEYCRYGELAGLERTADETSQMKLALSHLEKVQQLALSLDSGLGWLSGPDKSIRDQICRRPPTVFGCSHGVKDSKRQAQDQLWEDIETAHRVAGTADLLKEATLCRAPLRSSIPAIPGLSRTRYSNPSFWSQMDSGLVSQTPKGVGASEDADPDASSSGVLYTCNHDPETELEYNDLSRAGGGGGFRPAILHEYQREWLLEADWAQRAFLMSYMLAVVDNGPVFRQVTTLNLARISSRFLPLMGRHDFWSALPNLKEVSLQVKPDWRTVSRDAAGIVEITNVHPSSAHEDAYRLLGEHIGTRSCIKTLHFGWISGGEHAEGMYARNNHVLPAPITTAGKLMQHWTDDPDMLRLPYVEKLTLSNCWSSPGAILNLMSNLEKAALRKVEFNSVSLTADPRFTLAAGGAPNQQLAQLHALQAVQAIAANMNGAAAQAVATGLQNAILGAPAPAPAGGVQNGPALTNAQQQALTNQMQQWINHAPFHAQQHMVQAFATLGHNFAGNVNLPPAPHGGGPHVQQPAGVPNPTQPQQWYDNPREYSWPDIIDKLSPSVRLTHYRPHDEFDPPRPNRREDTQLRLLSFVSCGYVQLASATFDQSTLEAPIPHRPGPYFIRRRAALFPMMLSSSDRYLGRIVQYMSDREQDTLRYAWGCRMGWEDEKRAEEAEFDGYLPGGTGRFTGTVTRNMEPLGGVY